jgi:hypothetical protein
MVLRAGVVAADTTTTVVDVPATNGVQRFLYIRPDNPVATIVHLPGGEGSLGIQGDGTMTTQVAVCSPIVRNRAAYAQRGLALALVDATSTGFVGEFSDIREVVRHVQGRDNVPVWIVGGSASTATVAIVARDLPSTSPVGVIFYSPANLPSTLAAAVRRPALVIYHPEDAGAFGAQVHNALTSAPVKERVVVQGGSNSGCGYHLFQGRDAEFVAQTAGFIERHNASLATVNYQGLWWRSPAGSEDGWGLNLAHQGDILFGTWFTYGADGQPMWYVMANGAKTGERAYSGTLYRTTGAPFASYDRAQFRAFEVGSATFTFADADNGTFAYTVDGVSQTKPITRQVFASPVPRCAPGSPSATNFQDIWWAAPAASEDGWGVNLTHQGSTLFGTWFTYGASGQPVWYVMTTSRVGDAQRYTGPLHRTTGSPFQSYDASRFQASQVGTATFDFSGASAGTFSYAVDSISQSKAITRMAFSSPTACN